MATHKSPWQEEEAIEVVNLTGGAPGGSTSAMAVSPVKGFVTKVGAAFTSSVASTATVLATLWNATGSVSLQGSTVVGTAALAKGVAAIYTLASSVAINEGDCVQFTTSGGPTSAEAATCFAIVTPLPMYRTG